MSITITYAKDGKTCQANIKDFKEFSQLYGFACDQFAVPQDLRVNYCLAASKMGFVFTNLQFMEKVLGKFSFLLLWRVQDPRERSSSL